MNSSHRALLSTCILCSAIVGCAEQRRTSTFEHPELAVVRLYCASPHRAGLTECRGFVVSPDGVIATSLRAIEGCTEITATPPDGPSLKAVLMEVDREGDVALLKAPGEHMAYLHLETDEFDPGIHVRVAGSGGITHGLFDRWENFGEDIEFTAPITPLDIGAPLLADDGKAIGVVLGPYDGRRAESLATPIYHVLRMLPKLGGQ